MPTCMEVCEKWVEFCQVPEPEREVMAVRFYNQNPGGDRGAIWHIYDAYSMMIDAGFMEGPAAITHLYTKESGQHTACCGKDPFRLEWRARYTYDPHAVTCPERSSP